MIKKNLLRVLFCMLMLFLALMLKSSVQAMTFTYNDVEHTLPDLPEESMDFDGVHYTIAYGSSSDAYILISYVNYEEGVTFASTTNNYSGRFYIFGQNGEDVGARLRIWTIENDSWVLIDSSSDDCFWYYNQNDLNCSNFIYSTVDLYEITSNVINGYTPDILFFQRTPLTEGIVAPETILVPIVEEEKETMEMTLKEIILILPMILVVVVSLIGLRKALRMLFSLLRQS